MHDASSVALPRKEEGGLEILERLARHEDWPLADCTCGTLSSVQVWPALVIIGRVASLMELCALKSARLAPWMTVKINLIPPDTTWNGPRRHARTSLEPSVHCI